MSIRILLVDDHQIILEGLKTLFMQTQGFEVVGEARDGRSAVLLAQKLQPDIVIMDVTIPEVNGIEATKQIVAKTTNTRVIALSMHADQFFVTEMFKAGAKGYLLKDDDFDNVLVAIKTVLNGKVFVSPTLSDLSVKEYIRYIPEVEPDTAMLISLSNRERELLEFIASGKSTKEIATILHVSTKTLYTHRENIMRKLNLKNSNELIKMATLLMMHKK
ncbi:MAG: response regulator transcription factor [Caldiserica bacterium]|jgi:DNA-binding NarL/FixJ family response regulator|nr:response regulator transcription factor [Caldisericota bacterium]